MTTDFIGPQLEDALSGPDFKERWARLRHTPMGAVWQRTYGRNGRHTLFITMTARTQPGPPGSLSQLVYTMDDRDFPIVP